MPEPKKTRLFRWVWRLLPVAAGIVIGLFGLYWHHSYHIKLYELHSEGLIADRPPEEIPAVPIVPRHGWQQHSIPGMDLELPAGIVRREEPNRTGHVIFLNPSQKDDGYIVTPPWDPRPELQAAFASFDLADAPSRWPTYLDLQRAALAASYASFNWNISRSEAKRLLALCLYRNFATFGEPTRYCYQENESSCWLIVVGVSHILVDLQSRDGTAHAQIMVFKPPSFDEALARLATVCDSVRFTGHKTPP